MGNRIAKYVYDGTELESSTFYVRDAQGTTIAVYDEKVTIEEIAGVNTPTLKYALAERHIYGSSRLGMDTTEVVIPVNATLTVEPTAETNVSRYLGKRLYELSNHLGNVLTVISDRKIAVPVVSSAEFGYYRPHIVSVTDYSPFGVALTARTWSDQEYRYGFQAQEQDNEMWGGSVTYKYRVEDPRLGRFFAVDPLFAKYPWNSNYAFSENMVIHMVELEGLEAENYSIPNQYDCLVIVNQGSEGTPPDKDKTQVKNNEESSRSPNDLNDLDILEDWDECNVDVLQFSSSDDDRTKNSIDQTISNFYKMNPSGTVILVGHSLGADNNVEMVKENGDLFVDLMVTIDICDGVEYDDDEIPCNVRTCYNYYQTNWFDFGGEEVSQAFGCDSNEVVNIPVENCTHTTIDSKISGDLINIFKWYVNK